jgi:aldehyde dehydrogenase (NAD+)
MSAAARHLTPVTLELGGKSPASSPEDADLDLPQSALRGESLERRSDLCRSRSYLGQAEQQGS